MAIFVSLSQLAGQTAALNDSGEAVGYFQDTSGQYGFAYSNGTYTLLSPTGASSTTATAVNDSGEVAGYYRDLGIHGFVYSNGTYTTLDAPRATSTWATAIDSSGDVAGYFRDATGFHGFAYGNGAFSTLDVPGAAFTKAMGIDGDGDVAGNFSDGNDTHGFIYSAGVYTTLNGPGAIDTFVQAINSSGKVVGYYSDAWDAHGFVYSNNTFTVINVPGAADTYIYAINSAGDIAGTYTDATGRHGFVESNGEFSTFDVPGSRTTMVTGINSDDAVSGYYTDANGQHAFVTVVPTVKSISATSDSGATNLNADHVITITLQINETVDVGGTPLLQLNDNERATYVAGSGTARLTFTYTVQSGDNAAHLQVTLLDLDGASIKDDAGASLPTAVTAYLDLTIDTVAPTITIGQLVDDTGASSTDLITSDGHVTLSGNVADANGISSVEVFDGKTDLGAATIDHGTWSYSALFGEGSHTLSAVATDWAGNSTATAAQPTFLVDTTPPVPVLLNAAFDQFSGSTTLKGLSEAQSNVSVFDAGVFVGITKAAADGTWSLQTSIVGKTVQTYTESATDLAGNTGSSPGVALLYEQRSNQSLVGGDGNDVLVANHMDTLTGGAGSDTFVFNPGFGKATITDFNVSQDVLLLDHSLFFTPTGSQVLAQSHDVTTGMVISFNPANTITLTGVHMADLQAHPSDFHLF